VTQVELANLLADALRLWEMNGKVSAVEDGLEIATTGARCMVRRSGPPFRWSVQTDAGQAAGRAPRPCPSVLSLLSVLRRWLQPVA
jgi:hypothetical protein